VGALQGLNLALFINAQHHGFIRRIQMLSHDIAHLFNKEGIGGELKVTLPIRLETKSAPDAVNRGLGETGLYGQRSHADRASLEALKQEFDNTLHRVKWWVSGLCYSPRSKGKLIVQIQERRN